MAALKAGILLAGRYQLLKPLGKGGEGSVWLARHCKTEQLWAVKEIFRAREGGDIHELNMRKKLYHASLPQILDVLEFEGCVYLIMEYIRGKPLDVVLQKQGRLSVEQVLDIGIQLSDVLYYLHTRKTPVYHLDIKPANLICQKDGRLMLVDFGAAWREEPEKTLRNGMGTSGYAAPEQYDISRQVDARTDLYGAGASLYQLISGVRYSGILAKSGIPGCPELLAAVIKKCLAAEPEKRYDNGRQLKKALQKIQKKRDRQKRRYQIWISALFAVIVLGIALREIPGEFQQQSSETWNYEKLLQEALCVGGEEANTYYLRAAFLEPKRLALYLQMLQQADRDGEFTLEEERQLRMLLHTIPLGGEQTYEELLTQNPVAYGQFASQLALIYWYDFAGQEGKKIAAGWFAKALKQEEWLSDQEKQQDWYLQACLFEKISGYYEQLGMRKENERLENTAADYWENLNQIYQTGLDEKTEPFIMLRFWEETLDQIIFLADTFETAGISPEELLQRIIWIRERAAQYVKIQERPEGEGKLVKQILEKAITAEEIVERMKQ